MNGLQATIVRNLEQRMAHSLTLKLFTQNGPRKRVCLDHGCMELMLSDLLVLHRKAIRDELLEQGIVTAL